MTTATEIVDSLRQDFMLVKKKQSLLQSYLDLGGDDNFFSINNDYYASGGEEVIRLLDNCATLIKHSLKDAEEGCQLDKTFLADKLYFYNIEEYLAQSVIPNTFKNW
jgi:hypothetical protein